MGAAMLCSCSGGDNKPTQTVTASEFPKETVQTGQPSPGSGALVLARDNRLLIRDTAGKERVLLQVPPNTFPTFPMWSPDGNQIAYAQATIFTGQPNADWGGDIYLVDATGGSPKLLWKHDQ